MNNDEPVTLSAPLVPQTSVSGRVVRETASEGVLLLNERGDILLSNARGFQLLGLATNSHGANLWTHLGQIRAVTFLEVLSHAVKDGKSGEAEEEIKTLGTRLKGRLFPYNGFFTLHITHEVVKLRKERLRKRALAQYKGLLNAVSAAVWEWRIGGGDIYWQGRKLAHLLGYSRRRFTIDFWRQHVYPGDSRCIRQAYARALRQNDTHYSYEYRLQNSNGAYIHVRERATILRNAKGKPVKVIGVTEDITTEKLHQQALQEATRSYQVLFDNAPMPQWIYEAQSLRILKVNKAAVLHYGYTREAFLEKTLFDICVEADPSRLLLESQQEGASTTTWTHVQEGGQQIVVEAAVTPVEYENKKAYLSTLNDLTEKRKLQDQLLKEKVRKQRAVTRAAITAQEKERQQIGGELHDNINQVLTAATLYLDMAEHSDPLQKDWIHKAQQQLHQVINEIRSLSKSLAPPVLADCGLRESLEELVEPYRNAQKFEVLLNCDDAADTIDPAIQLALYRIIQEGLNNIVKHAAATLVTLQVQVDQKVSLLIQDDGVGFTTSDKRKGVGLQHIINRAEAYQGQVWIESQPGQGCRVKVEIPLY